MAIGTKLKQNSLTFPWLLAQNKIPWLFPDHYFFPCFPCFPDPVGTLIHVFIQHCHRLPGVSRHTLTSSSVEKTAAKSNVVWTIPSVVESRSIIHSVVTVYGGSYDSPKQILTNMALKNMTNDHLLLITCYKSWIIIWHYHIHWSIMA